jgi:molecular chaperone DnaK
MTSAAAPFDVTILRIAGKDLTVLATAGDVRLGGRDWDERLFKHMADQFMHAHGEDPRDNPVSAQNLMLTAEETKKVLSARKSAHFVVNHAGKTFAGDVTRQQFDELTQDLLYRSENRLSRVVKQAKLQWTEVNEVLAVGGSTRMPQVLEMLYRVTGKEPNCSLSPDEAVADGAAIHANIVATRPPTAAAAPVAKTSPAAPKASSAAAPSLPLPLPPPLSAKAVSAKTPAPAIDAAPGVLKYFTQRVLDLLRAIHTTNVNAHSLGVVVTDKANRQRVSVLIPHNTQLPFSMKRRFGTVRDNQTTVTARVVEGESPMPDECSQVGSCSIEHLPPKLPKGSPVEVTFTYDNSGRLHVEAMEVTSGKWASVAIERRAGPPDAKLRDTVEKQSGGSSERAAHSDKPARVN